MLEVKSSSKLMEADGETTEEPEPVVAWVSEAASVADDKRLVRLAGRASEDADASPEAVAEEGSELVSVGPEDGVAASELSPVEPDRVAVGSSEAEAEVGESAEVDAVSLAVAGSDEGNADASVLASLTDGSVVAADVAASVVEKKDSGAAMTMIPGAVPEGSSDARTVGAVICSPAVGVYRTVVVRKRALRTGDTMKTPGKVPIGGIVETVTRLAISTAPFNDVAPLTVDVTKAAGFVPTTTVPRPVPVGRKVVSGIVPEAPIDPV